MATVVPPQPLDEPRGLKVFVLNAKKLPNTEWFGKIDPFCTVHLSGKEQVQHRTATISGALNPVWNHECLFPDYVNGDSLEFTIWDKDIFKNDPVGKGVLKSDDFAREGFEGSIALLRKGKPSKATLAVKVELPKEPPPILAVRESVALQASKPLSPMLLASLMPSESEQALAKQWQQKSGKFSSKEGGGGRPFPGPELIHTGLLRLQERGRSELFQCWLFPDRLMYFGGIGGKSGRLQPFDLFRCNDIQSFDYSQNRFVFHKFKYPYTLRLAFTTPKEGTQWMLGFVRAELHLQPSERTL